jgi:hypothetical protein
VIIYLGPRLLEGTSDLPGSLGRAVPTPDCSGDASLCGLAPGGVFQASPVTRECGGLLLHRFTLTPVRGGLLFCGTVHGVAPCPISGPPCPAELGLSSPRCRGAITSPALICHKLLFAAQDTEKNRKFIWAWMSNIISAFHQWPCSPKHLLPCSGPLICILPRRYQSLQ